VAPDAGHAAAREKGDEALELLRKNPKDLLAGLMFLAFGVFFFIYGQEYQIGTARRMGPGYFPFYLSIILMVIGALVTLNGVLRQGTPLGRFAWKELAVITAGILLFAFLVRPGGIVPAVMVFVFFVAFAYPPVNITKSVLLATVVAMFCWYVFSFGLGLPFGFLGAAFEPASASLDAMLRAPAFGVATGLPIMLWSWGTVLVASVLVGGIAVLAKTQGR
jgi:hypothetical protein